MTTCMLAVKIVVIDNINNRICPSMYIKSSWATQQSPTSLGTQLLESLA